jgi:colicin import membrane protein
MSGFALRDPSHVEPGLVPAGILAVLVHLLFLGFLIFGLSWKTYPPENMMVDLWSSLPQPPQPAPPPAEPVPPPQPPQPAPPPAEPVPPPPAPEPVQPPPEVKEAPPPPPPPKPEIAIKEKIEKPKPVGKKPVEKKLAETKQPAQQDQKERIEKEVKAQKEKEEKALKEQQARVAAEVEQLRREQEANEKLQAQAAAQSRLANEIAEYKARILAKIKRNIIMPPDLPGNPVAEFDVTLLPGGDILDAKLRKSSGYTAFDEAVERAIFLSKPLPLPPDPALFPKFRNLNLRVHYRE